MLNTAGAELPTRAAPPTADLLPARECKPSTFCVTTPPRMPSSSSRESALRHMSTQMRACMHTVSGLRAQNNCELLLHATTNTTEGLLMVVSKQWFGFVGGRYFPYPF